MEKLQGVLQENLLSLLCFSDTAFQLVRNSVEPNLFTTAVYRDIVARVHDYIDQFKKPPKDHLPDLLEDVLEDQRSGALYQDVMQAVFATRETLNEKYILKQLENFVRLQRLKLGIIRASELIKEGDAEKAEVELEKSLKERLSLFSPGLTLKEGLRRLKNNELVRDVMKLGIEQLDKHQLGPARKELHTLIGVKKAGKSWWCLHCAKQALMIRWRVAYVTLEVSEDRLATRSLQSLFSLHEKKAERLQITRFETDELGRVAKFKQERLNRPSLEDEEGLKIAGEELAKFHASNNLRIKEFPTGSLTVNGLRTYLDSLERLDNFIPDLLIVDYPQLMHIDPRHYRLELGAVVRDLRGIGVERNMAIVVVAQSNREGAKSNTVKDTDIGEDFSIIQTSDVVLTYSQTEAEHQLGLARLHVAASRISRQFIRVMISQNYDIGQFCIDSAYMMDNYWEAIKQTSGKNLSDLEIDQFNTTETMHNKRLKLKPGLKIT